MSTNCCAVCGGVLDKTLAVHDRPDRFEKHVGIADQDYRREWVCCRSCGSVTNRHRPGNLEKLKALAENYYEVDLGGSNIAAKYDLVMNLPWGRSDNAGRSERIHAELRAIYRSATKRDGRRRRVLDIGAGTGVFLSRFLDDASAANEEWEGVAVEPDPIAAEHLRSLAKFAVCEGIYDRQFELKEFDLVTLNKVVEHVAEPMLFVRLVAAALHATRGVLYIEVPDMLTVNLRPPTDNILGALHHHLYTPLGLAFLIERAELTCLKIGRVLEPSGKITIYGFATRPVATNLLFALPS